MLVIKVNKKLTNNKQTEKNIPARLDKKTVKFKILINSILDKNYSFTNLKNNNGHKELDNFIRNTVGKSLTISEVDKLYRRTQGPKDSIKINDTDFELVHYGQNNKAFRIFGYYLNGYFILKRLDCNHETHK